MDQHRGGRAPQTHGLLHGARTAAISPLRSPGLQSDGGGLRLVDFKGIIQGSKIYSNIANGSGAGIHLSTTGGARIPKIFPLLRMTGGGANMNNNTVSRALAGLPG